jgi:hypothetical protein
LTKSSRGQVNLDSISPAITGLVAALTECEMESAE